MNSYVEFFTYLDPIQIGKKTAFSFYLFGSSFSLFTYSDLIFFFYLFGSFFFFFFFLPFRIRFFLFAFSDPFFFFLFLFTFLDQLFHLFTFSDRQNDRKSNNIPFYRISPGSRAWSLNNWAKLLCSTQHQCR